MARSTRAGLSDANRRHITIYAFNYPRMADSLVTGM